MRVARRRVSRLLDRCRAKWRMEEDARKRNEQSAEDQKRQRRQADIEFFNGWEPFYATARTEIEMGGRRVCRLARHAAIAEQMNYYGSPRIAGKL